MLPRFLYYFSVAFAIVAHRFEWLVVGAIVSAMIFSAIAVLHLFVILTQARGPVIDLDVIAIVSLCCVGVTMVSSALAWSNALKESAARTIVLRWGGMLVVGGFFGTFLHFGKLGVLKTVWRNCIDLSGTPLTAASRLAVPSTSFNCTYACFSATPSSIREASETIVQKYNSNDRNWSFWLWMGSAIISYVLGLFAMAGNVDAHSGHPSWSPFMHHLSAGVASLSCVLVIVVSKWLFLHTGLYPGGGAVPTVDQWGPWVSAGIAAIGAAQYAVLAPKDASRAQESDAEASGATAAGASASHSNVIPLLPVVATSIGVTTGDTPLLESSSTSATQ
jgi:hypothetical protein